eukprot:scaffold15510_cov213-Amphora_coffeaeformis.AAC.4
MSLLFQRIFVGVIPSANKREKVVTSTRPESGQGELRQYVRCNVVAMPTTLAFGRRTIFVRQMKSVTLENVMGAKRGRLSARQEEEEEEEERLPAGVVLLWQKSRSIDREVWPPFWIASFPFCF